MRDMIPGGTRNSRELLISQSSAPAEAPQWFRDWLASGIPFDMRFNPAGIAQPGTPLNKETLLTDDTATLIGLSGDPTVDDAFRATHNNTLTANKFRILQLPPGYTRNIDTRYNTYDYNWRQRGIPLNFTGYLRPQTLNGSAGAYRFVGMYYDSNSDRVALAPNSPSLGNNYSNPIAVAGTDYIVYLGANANTLGGGRYNTRTNSWTTIPAPPRNCRYTQYTVYNKKIYYPHIGDTSSSYSSQPISIYDVETNTWSSSANPSGGFYLDSNNTMIAAGKYIIFSGNQGASSGYDGVGTSRVVYDMETNTWQSITSPVSLLRNVCGYYLSNGIPHVVFSNATASQLSPTTGNRIYLLNLETKAWTYITPPAAVYAESIYTLDDRYIMCSGTASTYLYDIFTGTWVTMGSNVVSVSDGFLGTYITIYNNILYLFHSNKGGLYKYNLEVGGGFVLVGYIGAAQGVGNLYGVSIGGADSSGSRSPVIIGDKLIMRASAGAGALTGVETFVIGVYNMVKDTLNWYTVPIEVTHEASLRYNLVNNHLCALSGPLSDALDVTRVLLPIDLSKLR